MAYTTLTVRQDIAKRLKTAKTVGESYSDLLARLLDNQPAKCVEEWLETLAPLEGRGVYTQPERALLKADQRTPRDSTARRKRHAAP